MKIDLHNYEAYLLDYFEGNLNTHDTEALRAFAAEHPELEIDLSPNNLITLPPTSANDTPVFDLKDSLKKNTLVMENNLAFEYLENQLDAQAKALFENELKTNAALANELALYQRTLLSADASLQFELKSELYRLEGDAALAFLSVENTLSNKDVELVESRLLTNADFKSQVSAYNKTILVPDFSVTYPDKNQLKHKEATIIALFNWRVISGIAAGVALLVGLYVVSRSGETPLKPGNTFAAKDSLLTPLESVQNKGNANLAQAKNAKEKGKIKIKNSIIRQLNKDSLDQANNPLANTTARKEKSKIKNSIIRQLGKDTSTNSAFANQFNAKEKSKLKIKNSIIRQLAKDTATTELASQSGRKDKPKVKVKTSIIRQLGKDTTNTQLANQTKPIDKLPTAVNTLSASTLANTNSKLADKVERIKIIPTETDTEESVTTVDASASQKKTLWSRALNAAGQLNKLGLKSVNGDSDDKSDVLSLSQVSVELKKSK